VQTLALRSIARVGVRLLASDDSYDCSNMDTNRPNFSKPEGGDAAREAGSTLARQWSAVQDAAEAIAMMAGLAKEEPSDKCRNFAILIRDVEGWRLELAKNHVADMAAMMQPGLAALLASNARGQDATAAALTLWREYFVAREAVLDLLPESGKMGPRRSA